MTAIALLLTSLLNTLSTFRCEQRRPALPSSRVRKAKANFAKKTQGQEKGSSQPLKSRRNVFQQRKYIWVCTSESLQLMSADYCSTYRNCAYEQCPAFGSFPFQMFWCKADGRGFCLFVWSSNGNSASRSWSYCFFKVFYSSFPVSWSPFNMHIVQAHDRPSSPKHTSKAICIICPCHQQTFSKTIPFYTGHLWWRVNFWSLRALHNGRLWDQGLDPLSNNKKSYIMVNIL